MVFLLPPVTRDPPVVSVSGFDAGCSYHLVLVMCDIQNETKYFNFFLIGGFERFLSFKGAKVAYLIWVNLLLVLL